MIVDDPIPLTGWIFCGLSTIKPILLLGLTANGVLDDTNNKSIWQSDSPAYVYEILDIRRLTLSDEFETLKNWLNKCRFVKGPRL